MDIAKIVKVIGVVHQVVKAATPVAQELRAALAQAGVTEADLAALDVSLDKIQETARREMEAKS